VQAIEPGLAVIAVALVSECEVDIRMAKGACLLLCLLMAGPAVAEVTEAFDLATYEVAQRAGETLLGALNRHSPIRRGGQVFHGYTRWNIRWNFRWDTNVQGRCAITEVKTALSVYMQLPALDESTARRRTEFDDYLPALRLHEEGHRQIATQAARRIDQAIFSLQPMRSCQALETEANRRGYEILNAANAKDDAYDVDTKHGCTQGACLY